jgi:hypothetical protein
MPIWKGADADARTEVLSDRREGRAGLRPVLLCGEGKWFWTMRDRQSFPIRTAPRSYSDGIRSLIAAREPAC